MRVNLIVAAACGLAALGAAPAVFAEGQAHWGYQGHGKPAKWAELDAGFKTCKLGKLQSPINLETKKVEKSADAKPLGFAYAGGAGDVVNNGHTIQVNLPAGGAVTIDGTEYKLLQFHFHTPSEEMFDGKPYPLVAHLVHKSAQGQLAVVAVLFKLGHENTTLKPVFAHLPAKSGETLKLDGSLNAADLLPADRSYYAFMGSLTTPPCSEEVRWQVLKTPVEVSAAQLASFKKLYAMNARPVQPLNGRKVVLGP
ncbi:carbonic anhydrase [Aquabacterium sp.]|uniref:carbonic anhydrase n=1 Tax=Aquabacterium sp. TaxID=1872578 RepID=UPI002C0391AA|nr:carbonic anhydrase family protein [Aquabacterium sp.]HSW07469.1 carbonic anhydrase family protein [Aquabacterium sp.]